MTSESKYAFLTACDMPVISTDYAKYMMEMTRKRLPDAVISEKGDWIEPFHAFYNRDLAEDICRSVQGGIYKIFDVIKNKEVLKISESKVREFSPDLGIFTNLNDVQDLEEFMGSLESGGEDNVLLQGN